MKPLVEELSKKYGVLEPLQTKNTINGQVEELKETITKEADVPVILLGWSWGAWLSFITTSQYSRLVSKLVLVGAGPFEASYAKPIMPTRLSRLSEKDRERVGEITKLLQENWVPAGSSLFEEFGNLLSKADSYNPIPSKENSVETQHNIYQSVWPEAEKLRENGDLLNYGKNITCPVVVIHGDYDPHPFEGVKEPLTKVVKNTEFIFLNNCGHHPWLEKEAKEEFYKTLDRVMSPKKD